MTDGQLLQEFVARKSQAAFTELVQRHIDWVYSTARRLVVDPQLAEDVTQAVFILVARKAAQLAAHRQFNGWLFRTTRFCAANALKQQANRRRHEQEARSMRTQNAPDEPLWSALAPQLDIALARLSTLDREAIILRFYQGKNAAEVGLSLGVTEGAAKKRIQRALEKIRAAFTGKAAAVNATVFTTLLAANVTHSAPPHVLAAVALPAAHVPAATALAKTVANAMTWAKLKVAASLLAAVSLTAAASYEAVIRTFPADAVPPASAPLTAAPSSSPAPPSANTPVVFDPLYEKAPPSKPDLTMPLGPNTFAVTAVLRFGPDGKLLAVNNLGRPLDPASLPLAKIAPPVGAGITKDIVLVQLQPALGRYDIDRLRIFNHATRRYIADVYVTPVPGMAALQITAPPGMLPPRIDLWLDAASYDATSTPVNLPATKTAAVTIAGSIVSFADIRDGSWNFDHGAFTILNGDKGERTSLQLHATQPWTAGRYQIAAVSTDHRKYLSNFSIDFHYNPAPILDFPFGLAQIDHFELRPDGRHPPFYFDGVTLPSIAGIPVTSPIPVPVIVRATDSAMVDLPSGATIELAGIAHSPSTDGIWWGFDGAPVDTPRGKSTSSVTPQEHYQSRELLARAYNVPRNRADILWQLPSARGWAGGGDGKTSRITAALPAQGPVTVLIGLPVKPWQTLEEIPLASLPAAAKCWPYMIYSATQQDDHVLLSLAIMSMPDNLRFVLIDSHGKIHLPDSDSSSGEDKIPPWGMQKSHITYANLRLEDVHALRFETRPVEYAEFQNVPMEPR